MRKLLLLPAFILAACTSQTNPNSYTDAKLQELQNRINQEKLKEKPDQDLIDKDEKTLHVKRTQNSLYNSNMKLLQNKMDGHTKMYSLKGKYKVMVVPVEFSNATMAKPEFFEIGSNGKSQAQDYLFGSNPNSMRNYYQHASLGQLDVDGIVTEPIKVDKPLEFYGEAVPGRSDVNARGLVRDVLVKMMKSHTNKTWWEGFDNWDLGDYDNDGTFAEPDGFIDAVILIYAGKDQASCQRTFDPQGTRPASADVPQGPRQAATVECFNRIWPHRWSMAIDPNDPLFTEKGPIVEGSQRPSFNGLKITDKLYALDYNMQSEFSERSTFMHEFGHSLTLPDIYASGGENSTGSWELMSSNAPLEAQELSSYSKLSLGWLLPKVIEQGESQGLYLGSYNYVSPAQKDPYSNYSGPNEVVDWNGAQQQKVSVVSVVPDSGEPVYRSAIVTTEPTTEKIDVVKTLVSNGKKVAYTGRYDNGSKALTLKLQVPATGDATLSFDTIWAIETDHNFDSLSPTFGMTGDYDIGQVFIDGDLKEELRMFSGDADLDTLVESNLNCDVPRVKEIRLKRINKTWTSDEKKEFVSLLDSCRTPVWLNKTYDLSAHRGQEITLEIRYVTDAGYNEMGIVIDNVKLGSTVYDFETSNSLSEWKLLENGQDEVSYNQFYLMEYRTPGVKYEAGGKLHSENMDNNIEIPAQAMFLNETETGSKDMFSRVRFVKMNYQRGLVVWYFNSKFNRVENTPTDFNGRGYLLVLNSKVKELPLPGPLGAKDLMDENGMYLSDDVVIEKLKDQRTEFVCAMFTRYSTYINGEAPSCTGYAWLDALQNIKWDGANLIYRRELINDVHPTMRDQYFAVEVPYRNNATIRTGLSPFRPADDEAMSPLSVYKVENGSTVLDSALTKTTSTFAPVSSFKDTDNKWSTDERFQSDSVVVEKHGFKFRVVSPDKRITERYDNTNDPESNEAVFRKPMVKVLVGWE